MSNVKQRRSVDERAIDESLRIVEMLSDPASYDGEASGVECVETHISWVFLTDRHAYKLKKPVRFDFLDFSTPQRRRQACDEEVRLNRRLARHVYLGVVPIVRHNRHLALAGSGVAVDWLVKMRRLPQQRSLDRLIESRQLVREQVDQIAELLSQFYTQLPPLMMRTGDYQQRLERYVQENRAALLKSESDLDREVVHRTHEAQLLLLQLARDAFDHRVLDGRIVEGHGDLRPEHIYFAPHPTIIDCIEFNAEFRQLDVMDELCFLAMECDRLGATNVGQAIIARYRADADDRCPERLTAYYKSYRACVRAKVAALRAVQLADAPRAAAIASAAEYLRLADEYRKQIGLPVLLVVRGLSGTGKTTLATRLAETLGIERFETDAIRRELFGKSDSPAGYGEANYEPERRARVYDELLRRAGALIETGRSVIVDGTFLTTASRATAPALAGGGRAIPLVVQCHSTEEVARERIEARAEWWCAVRISAGVLCASTRTRRARSTRRAGLSHRCHDQHDRDDRSRAPATPHGLAARVTGGELEIHLRPRLEYGTLRSATLANAVP